MAHTDSEVARVLSALQGRFAGHSIHQQSRPSSPSKGGGEAGKVWVIPAGVGSDLARPATLLALVERWCLLEESQKINVLLGIAHVGQKKMQSVRGSVLRLAELARADSSDWVRVLGHTLGDVGATGKMTALEEVEGGSAVRLELEAAVDQLYAVVLAKLPELRLSTSMLSCVSPQVAEATAPPATRNVYGARPSTQLLEQVMSCAEKKEATRTNGCPRRASTAAPATISRRASGVDGSAEPLSAPMSRLGSPEPSDSARAGFSDLFGASDSDNADVAEPEACASRLSLNVRSSHRADHVGRMARLLAAAADPPPASASDPRRPSLGVSRSSTSSVAPGRGSSGPAASGISKIGMFAPRRRAAPTNAALPGVGLVSAPAIRRGSEAAGASGSQPGQGKRIQFSATDDTGIMNARDNLMQERRERANEEREAKKLRRQAEVEERKRKRAEAAEKKKAAAAENRSSPAKRGRQARASTSRNKSRDTTADASSANESGDDGDDDDDNDAQESAPARPGVYTPPQGYLAFSGNDQTIRSIYADTNSLTDEARLQLYCFFNSYPPPPDTPNELTITLNERIIEDPSHSAKPRREIMVLLIDFTTCQWQKKRLYRSIKQ
ncbi:hypothetical protein GGI20_005474 [Coemansia sp. BCRC 34301]|nr:hypothetical protein GGI20_005474 [Coemansia sp. BCRC 34301]